MIKSRSKYCYYSRVLNETETMNERGRQIQRVQAQSCTVRIFVTGCDAKHVSGVSSSALYTQQSHPIYPEHSKISSMGGQDNNSMGNKEPGWSGYSS